MIDKLLQAAFFIMAAFVIYLSYTTFIHHIRAATPPDKMAMETLKTLAAEQSRTISELSKIASGHLSPAVIIFLAVVLCGFLLVLVALVLSHKQKMETIMTQKQRQNEAFITSQDAYELLCADISGSGGRRELTHQQQDWSLAYPSDSTDFR